jgi:hypothetical protein
MGAPIGALAGGISTALTDILVALPNAGALTSVKEQITTGTGIITVPTAPSVGITSNTIGSNNSFTAWKEQVASSAAEWEVLGIVCGGGNLAIDSDYSCYQIGVGAAGAEAVRGTIQSGKSGGSSSIGTVNSILMLPRSFVVAASSRIAIRVAGLHSGVGKNTETSMVVLPTANRAAYDA